MKLNYNIEYFNKVCKSVSLNNKTSSDLNQYLIHKQLSHKNNNSVAQRSRGPKKGLYKGIFYSNERKCFIAKIHYKNKVYELGRFEYQEEAAKNYDYYAKKIFKDCYLNFKNYDYDTFKPKKTLNIEV